jgi:hypothetical protein
MTGMRGVLMATTSAPDNVIQPLRHGAPRLGPDPDPVACRPSPENQEANDGRSQEEDLQVEDP